MDRNFQRALPLVLKEEGGWSDHPQDPGGATMKGVTLATFRRYVMPKATKEDLRKITDEQIATVYYRHYWSAVNASALPAGVDYAVFDFAVNSGPDRAAKFLQRILSVEQDGRVGPKTIEAAQASNHRNLIDQLCDERLAFLRRLKTWPTFGKGWTKRVENVRKAAKLMVGHPADIKEVQVPVKVPVEKPVVPPTVDQKVAKETGFWSKISGAIGGGAVSLGWLAGADWKAIAVLGCLTLLFLTGLFVMRRQIIAGLKEIREELA